VNWHYVNADRQAGPVDDAQLEELVRSGQIQPETLVWREGMTTWLPFRDANTSVISTAVSPAAAVSPAIMGAHECACVECGQTFPRQDMISHGTMYFCANCKPILMQKLAEGAELNAGLLNYAGFWRRVAAELLDCFLLLALATGIDLVAGLGLPWSANTNSTGSNAVEILVSFAETLLQIGYYTLMIGKYGATLGKMACKIKVVAVDGGRVSYLKALCRDLAKYLSAFICLIGFIMAAFDAQKRALHDHICATRVVMK
jgi:uncharacterized RDD family membrane protein YckC